ILTDGESYYAVIKDVPMSADPNVQLSSESRKIKIFADIKSARWLDCDEKAEIKENAFPVKPFSYGTSYSVRVAKLIIP
ncbi:MAG: hypothetical protein IJU84_07985, partial [Clostridia bacterium]|nr:hypothetical protein [Clostridia bacterium]